MLYASGYKTEILNRLVAPFFSTPFFPRANNPRNGLLCWQSHHDGRLTGNAEEHENITVNLFRYEVVWRAAPDMKTLSAMFLYQKLSEEGCLTPHLSTRPLAVTKNEAL